MTASKKKNVVILGSTGSIGLQALDVIEKHSELFNVIGIAAKDKVSLLGEQIKRYKVAAAAIGDDAYYKELSQMVDNNCLVFAGVEGLCELASMPQADIIVVAVSGSVGIKPTLSAIRAQKRVALANKETLVAAGDIVIQKAKDCGAVIVPVDSEHSAIFQCLRGEERHLKKIWVTASGGPFKDFDTEQLENVTVEMALKHPNWVMGPKITVDSATLMNKGLEVIEAQHLFGINYDRIDVVIQRESIIHSMVELIDGSFLAHLGSHDMRIPIQYALTYPERVESSAQELDLLALGSLHFEKPDTIKFPALALAYQAGQTGGTMPAVLNAANEIAVKNFLNYKIAFSKISCLVAQVMEKHKAVQNPDLESILGADKWARQVCEELI